MQNLVVKVKGLLKRRQDSLTSEPFAVPCPCGRLLQGMRRRRHQVIRCPACREPNFILPASPLPVLRGEAEGPAPAPPPPPPPNPWRLPILAGVVTVAVVAGIFAVALQYLQRTEPTGVVDPVREMEARLQAAREAIQRREFNLACQNLSSALALHERLPDLGPASWRRKTAHLRRQTELMAERVPEPLDQLLRSWSGLNQKDLDILFQDYRGRAVVFDLQVLRDGAGQYQYQRRLGPELPNLELGDLELFKKLPLDQRQQRVIFGARLTAVKRDGMGRWTVFFQPDSAVLITDVDVTTACCPPVDEETREVLARQAGWAAEMQ